MSIPITLHINNEKYDVNVAPYHTLCDTMREELGMTEVKKSCTEGECGACTVLVDGKAINSCLFLTVKAEGKKITTIKGLSSHQTLHPLQEKFIEHGAIQCGYCTPGMILTSKAFLDKNDQPTEAEVRAGIAGNICRCTGYQQIIEAVMSAANEM